MRICAATARFRTPDSEPGFERLLMFVTGVTNIRDVLPFARHGRATASSDLRGEASVFPFGAALRGPGAGALGDGKAL